MAIETILDRLKTLEDNLHYLQAFKKRYKINDILNDKTLEWALRYGIFESSQIVIGVACALISDSTLEILKIIGNV
ncbi:hypothetical protein [Caldisericum exile]|uniref:hypothetical protein n=1 Tax=Caldisericum exile TaxID=693075 RepID=UPI00067FFA99|nr:hypothetical protein [Caldisericum exile]